MKIVGKKKQAWVCLMKHIIKDALENNYFHIEYEGNEPKGVIIQYDYNIGNNTFNITLKHAGFGEIQIEVYNNNYKISCGWLERKCRFALQVPSVVFIKRKIMTDILALPSLDYEIEYIDVIM